MQYNIEYCNETGVVHSAVRSASGRTDTRLNLQRKKRSHLTYIINNTQYNPFCGIINHEIAKSKHAMERKFYKKIPEIILRTTRFRKREWKPGFLEPVRRHQHQIRLLSQSHWLLAQTFSISMRQTDENVSPLTLKLAYRVKDNLPRSLTDMMENMWKNMRERE